jgi:hypothetical protein
MKLQLFKLVDSEKALNALMTQPLPAVTSFRLIDLLKQVKGKLDSYNEARNKLIVKYSPPPGEDGTVQVPSSAMPDFMAELQPMVMEEIELTFTPIKIDEIKDCKMSTVDMAVLEWLVVA